MAYVYGNNIGDQALAAERERSYFDSRADAEYARNVNSAARDQANAFQFRNLARQDYMDQSTADQLARAEQRQANQDAVAASRARFDRGLISEQSKLAREKFEEDKRYAKTQAEASGEVGPAFAVAISEKKKKEAELLAALNATEVAKKDAEAAGALYGLKVRPDGQFIFDPRTPPKAGTFTDANLTRLNARRNEALVSQRLLSSQLDSIKRALNQDISQAQRFKFGVQDDAVVDLQLGTRYPFAVAEVAATPAGGSSASRPGSPRSAGFTAVVAALDQLTGRGPKREAVQIGLRAGRITAEEAAELSGSF